MAALPGTYPSSCKPNKNKPIEFLEGIACWSILIEDCQNRVPVGKQSRQSIHCLDENPLFFHGNHSYTVFGALHHPNLWIGIHLFHSILVQEPNLPYCWLLRLLPHRAQVATSSGGGGLNGFCSLWKVQVYLRSYIDLDSWKQIQIQMVRVRVL